MGRTYTEIRIPHKSDEDKKDFEAKLTESLKKAGYSNRTEFIKEKLGELIAGEA